MLSDILDSKENWSLVAWRGRCMRAVVKSQICFLYWPERPSLGQTINDLGVLMAREAEVDEPLAVEHPRRFLQQRYPPPVVLDQVVVRG